MHCHLSVFEGIGPDVEPAANVKSEDAAVRVRVILDAREAMDVSHDHRVSLSHRAVERSVLARAACPVFV
jgi:hypothetical protein